MPDDVVLEDLPESLRMPLEAIVGPGYEDLVAGAPNALERLAAMSVVYLSYVEVIDQVELARDLAAAQSDDRGKRIEEHLRLVAAKLKAATFLHRLHKARGGPDDAKASG
jgi:hypothetical protein